MSLPDKREVERKTRLATVVVMGLFVLSAAETVAASHIAGRGSLRSKELVSIHLNLEMSAPTCAPTLTFIDQADRVLTATVGGTGYFVQDMTTGVCAVINTAAVEPGSAVAIFGCGGVGLNAIQGAALVNAAAVRGYLAAQEASAPYPVSGKSWVAPLSMSATTWTPYFFTASVTYGSVS